MVPLFVAFTLIPLIELYLLIRLAQVMGAASTVALVLITGLLGAALARAEGLRMLRGFRQAVAAGQVPEDGVVSAVLVLVGGILLVTPGVLTDLCGLLLMVPRTRKWLVSWVSQRVERGIANGHVHVVGGVGGPFGPQSPPQPPWSAGEPPRREVQVKARVIASEPSRRR